MARASANPHRFNRVVPWMVSVSFHLGLGLVGAFVFFVTEQALSSAEGRPIIVPNSFEDPAFAEHPGSTAPGEGNDPLHQNGLKDLARTEGWETNGAQNVASLLGGPNEAVGIFAGSGASVTPGQTTNAAAAYGTPGAGAGIGPRSTFYGTGGNATKLVYILDRSGSMIDNFPAVQREAMASINKLSANQFFSVIFVSDNFSSLGPGPFRLRRALPDAKKECADYMVKVAAEGANDGLLAPFAGAFNSAMAMDPDLIFFLTDGKFGDGLIAKVSDLNKNRHVHINTIAFVTEEPLYKAALQQLAQENGGTYKFIPQKEVGN